MNSNNGHHVAAGMTSAHRANTRQPLYVDGVLVDDVKKRRSEAMAESYDKVLAEIDENLLSSEEVKVSYEDLMKALDALHENMKKFSASFDGEG